MEFGALLVERKEGSCDLVGVGEKPEIILGWEVVVVANSDLTAPLGLNARLIDSYKLCFIVILFSHKMKLSTD